MGILTLSGELSLTEKNVWDLSNEELFNGADAHYEAIYQLDKDTTKNAKSLNQHIRDLALQLEELWKRGQTPYNQNDICQVITARLSKCSKNIRITVAQQLDKRFKRKYSKGENVGAPTIMIDGHDTNLQSSIILEKIKQDMAFAKQHVENLDANSVQEVQTIAEGFDNAVQKYCKENKINYVSATSTEPELDRLRREAKGSPTQCPTPAGVEQQNPKVSTDAEILQSLRTKSAQAIYRFGIAWRNLAINVDNYPPVLEGDDEKIAKLFNTLSPMLEDLTDIKTKRDRPQWCNILDIFQEVSKHHAASNDDLSVYGVSCKNCNARMHVIDKKRDRYRLYWRCPNYYRIGPEWVGCKKDEPLSRGASKERITEVQKKINQWAADLWETIDFMDAVLYWFRNYKQPYHTEHTKILEPKFQNRGN